MMQLRIHSALVSTCEKGKQPKKAMVVFMALQQRGVVPKKISYNAVTSVF